MNAISHLEATHSTAACLALLLLGAPVARGNETNNQSNPHIIVLNKEEYARFMAAAETYPPPLRPDIKWGESTNGLKCGISVLNWPDAWVFIETPLANIPYPNSSVVKMSQPAQEAPPVIGYWTGDSVPDSPVWIGAPSGLFGPMELRNVNGEKIPLLKPKANNPEEYPEILRWSILRPQFGGIGHGGPNTPHIGQWQGFQKYRDVQQAGGMLRNLASFFEVKETGEYQLTLWPKIYKRSEQPNEDHDIFQRIDLPPVTIPIRWNDNSEK